MGVCGGGDLSLLVLSRVVTRVGHMYACAIQEEDAKDFRSVRPRTPPSKQITQATATRRLFLSSRGIGQKGSNHGGDAGNRLSLAHARVR